MFAPPRAQGLIVGLGIFLGGTAAYAVSGLLFLPPWAWALWVVAVGVWAFFAAFLRDPERTPGEGIVSAADGRVREVLQEGDRLLISVFMNVTDVHVNRAPIAGTVGSVGEAGAGHRPAYQPDAGRNVSRTYGLETTLGRVEVVQITGILARRLVAFVGPGARLDKGSRFGMIVLGSRVDVWLPAGRVVPVVRPGDRVRAGATTIARERP